MYVLKNTGMYSTSSIYCLVLAHYQCMVDDGIVRVVLLKTVDGISENKVSTFDNSL